MLCSASGVRKQPRKAVVNGRAQGKRAWEHCGVQAGESTGGASGPPAQHEALFTPYISPQVSQ